MIRLRSLALASVFLGLIAANATATTLFSTLGQTSDDIFTLHSSTDLWNASDFKTGAQGATITSIRAALGNPDSIAHNFQVSLYSDSGGAVGSLLETFSTASLGAGVTGTNNYVSFTHAGATLAANTTYWVVLKMQEAISSDSPYWWLNYSDATDPGSVFTSVSTTPPYYTDNAGVDWYDYASGNRRMDITGTLITLVPEPGRMLLALAGFVGIFFRRRR